MRYVAMLVALLGLTQMATGAPAEQAQAGVKVSLLTDHSAVQPGQSFQAGVLLTLQDGWHVYWKNAGDSGLPTRIKWNLPAGFTAGPLEWPTPRLFLLPGDIRDIGYDGQVMLIAPIRPPEGWRGQAAIGADVQWLACKQLCVPGRQRLQASVEVGDRTILSQTETFAAWEARMPQPVSAGSPARGVTVQHAGQTYLVRVQETSPISDPVVFVAAPPGSDVTTQVRERNANGATVAITVAAAAVSSPEPPEVVVSWKTQTDVVKAVVLPLVAASP
jgi:thiol:disulfide interchange protein DsbD